ncbi:MAG: leucine-rich repeat domain-containing protein, partial [Mycoplasmataceae bacterium]|nr:leucine-rich repeat domain-containing protein [Mycoplasmataceae bacterium]
TSSGIESITIPTSVTLIGTNVFESCKSLSEVTWQTTYNTIPTATFKGCELLQSFEIPSTTGLTIGNEAFFGSGLTEITIPSTIKEIKSEAFASSENLESVKYPCNGVTASSDIFSGCRKLTSLEITGSGEMKDYTETERPWYSVRDKITTITIGDLVTTIGNYAFEGTGITSIELKTITKIGEKAFSNTNIKDLIIPSSVTSIGISAFASCSSLETLVYPTSVTEYKNTIFNECSKLKKITLIGSENKYTTQDYADTTQPWNNIMNTIEEVIISEQITTIGSYSFKGASLLKKLTIPTSVKTIKSFAFNGCNGLKQASLNHIETFEEQSFSSSGIQTLELSSVKTIGKQAFENCVGMTTVKYPQHEVAYETLIFNGCSKLTTIEIVGEGEMRDYESKKQPWIDIIGTITNVIFGEKVSTVGKYSFEEAVGLTSITWGGVVTVKDNAFEGCSTLSRIDLNENVKEIGLNAFHDCTSLSFISFNKIEKILSNSFNGTTKLTTISIPASVKQIDQDAFTNSKLISVIYAGIYEPGICSDYAFDADEVNGLKSVAVPMGYIASEDGNFCGKKTTTMGICGEECSFINFAADNSLVIEGGSMYTNWTEKADLPWKDAIELINKVSITVTSNIGHYAFQNAINLEVIELHNDMVEIGEHAFEGCIKLKEIRLPSGLKTIGNYSFSGMTQIQMISISVGVTTIGKQAFNGMTALTHVDFPNTVTTRETDIFDGCNQLKSLKLTGTGEMQNYDSADNQPWKSIKTQLTTIDFDTSVTTVGNNAFSGCSNIETITWGNIETVGNSAFSGCTSISSIEFPETMTTIEDYAFNECSGVTSIDLAEITTIGTNAFASTTVQ